MSTLGAPSGAFGPGIIDQSATEFFSVRPAVPPKVLVGDGQHGAVGLELAMAASASASFSAATPFLSICGDGLGGRAGERLLGRQTVLVVDHRDDRRPCPACSLSPSPLHAASTLCLVNLPMSAHRARPPLSRPAAAGRTGRPRARRRPPQPSPLRPRWSPVLADLDLAVRVVLDEDDALALYPLLLDSRTRRQSPSGLRLQTDSRHDDIERVGHDPSSPMDTAARPVTGEGAVGLRWSHFSQATEAQSGWTELR